MMFLYEYGYFVFIIPYTTHRNWQNNPYSIIYVILQLFYCYYSAKQIQDGYFVTSIPYSYSYPYKTTRILKRVKDDISTWGYISYKLYISIPFLYEINTLLEWITTKTVLEMGKWFSVEEMHRLFYEALHEVRFIERMNYIIREEVLFRMMNIFVQNHVLQKKRLFMVSLFFLEFLYYIDLLFLLYSLFLFYLYYYSLHHHLF